MKRTIISAAVLALAVAGAGVSIAAPGDGPGPNGKNDYGLCKAYFAGSDQGREQKRKAGPFQELERQAGVDSEDMAEDRDAKVADFCSTAFPGGKDAAPGGSGAGSKGGKPA